MTEAIRLISRRSPLALWQTNFVAQLLGRAHDRPTEIIGIDTTGDKVRDRPMPAIGVKGLFTRELEDALTEGTADIAVHSLKDLPSELPDGLVFAGTPGRAAPTDCLVAPRCSSVEELPHGATVATGSVRRRAQLAAVRPDLRFESLRGNIDTRLRKLEENGWDAIVMATAALHRLERADLVAAELLPPSFVPAAGQGAIGLEIRSDRDDVAEIVAAITDTDTMSAVTAERALMKRLEGGCSVPVAAHCVRVAQQWRLDGWAASDDGTSVIAEHAIGADPIALAADVADRMIAAGALEVLARD